MLNGAGMPGFQYLCHKSGLPLSIRLPGKQARPHVAHISRVVTLPESGIHQFKGIGSMGQQFNPHFHRGHSFYSSLLKRA